MSSTSLLTTPKKIKGRIKAPLRYFGGKTLLAQWIIDNFSEHSVYVEPFLGGGAVLLRKPKIHREIACELNPAVLNFWLSLKNDCGKLISHIQQVDLQDFDFKNQSLDTDTVKGAAVFWLQAQVAFMGVGTRWSTGVSKERQRKLKEVISRGAFSEDLLATHNRVKRVEFGSDGFKVLTDYIDTPDALLYLDPPYLMSARGSKDSRHIKGKPRRQYLCDWEEEDHISLCLMLKSARCKWVLSGFKNDIYSEHLGHPHATSNRIGSNKSQKECIWTNQS